MRDDIAKYAASDLLCYRATEPEALARRQAELWDPILAWSREALGASFVAAEGIMPVAQPEAAKAALARTLAGYDAFALTALHVMTTLTGSALLTLAHARGRLGVEDAWAAAHVDEDWQIAKWGEDAEAKARRRRRWRRDAGRQPAAGAARQPVELSSRALCPGSTLLLAPAVWGKLDPGNKCRDDNLRTATGWSA